MWVNSAIEFRLSVQNQQLRIWSKSKWVNMYLDKQFVFKKIDIIWDRQGVSKNLYHIINLVKYFVV